MARTLAFSSGPHHCLGAAAARLEGRVVIEELLRAMPDFVVDTARGSLRPGTLHPPFRISAHSTQVLTTCYLCTPTGGRSCTSRFVRLSRIPSSIPVTAPIGIATSLRPQKCPS